MKIKANLLLYPVSLLDKYLFCIRKYGCHDATMTTLTFSLAIWQSQIPNWGSHFLTEFSFTTNYSRFIIFVLKSLSMCSLLKILMHVCILFTYPHVRICLSKFQSIKTFYCALKRVFDLKRLFVSSVQFL